ncbi:hypothetical protein SADUNF_Sadunf08G0099000 [Salix dunnii]|uniref:Pentatricopeptide repeat-containing protein n=1 Tax=Salix dunnii TaxID=1413687 RepID=A0A835K265_9ROSI|nr:hypothetical protein SADUNF_Sadunf08G0099000 [Salix dunnii]
MSALRVFNSLVFTTHNRVTALSAENSEHTSKFRHKIPSQNSRREALKVLHQIHSQIITHGFEHEDYVAPKIISCYGSLKKMENAHKVFVQIPEPNASIWNAMFRGYSQNESHKDVIDLFRQMKGFDVMPNCFTFPVILKSCVKINALKEVTARRLFDLAPERDIVLWNTMISGYIQAKDVLSAFKRMLSDGTVVPNDATLVNVLSACARLGALDLGKWVHEYAESHGYKGNVNDYLVEFFSLDERHPEKEQIYGTLRTLTKLLRSSGYVPESDDGHCRVSFANILPAVAEIIAFCDLTGGINAGLGGLSTMSEAQNACHNEE